MEKKYYFFKTIKEKETLRVIALPGQTSGSESISESIKVTCSKELRSKYNPGTIFVGDSISYSEKKKCYVTKNFRRLTHEMKPEVEYYNKLFKSEFIDPYKEATLLEKICEDKSLVCPTSKGDGFYVNKDTWNLLIRNIVREDKDGCYVNTLLVGNTGTGKTQILSLLARATGRKLFIIDLSSISDAVSALLGQHKLSLSPDGKNTISIFSEAPFVKMIQTENALICLDEISRAPYGCQHILYPVLDNRRKLTIELADGESREIPVAKGVTFIATANVGSEYVSAQALDRALISRFMVVEFGNIPSSEETSVLVKRTKISEKDASMIVKIANNIRNLYNKQEISTTISIRETLMAASLVADGFSLGKAMEIVYLPIYESPDGSPNTGERGIIYKTILSY